MVEYDFHHESFVYKSHNISENFKQRLLKQTLESLWAIFIIYSSHLPLKKLSNIFKKLLFNCLNDWALALLYHLDNNTAYLEKYVGVSNGVFILDRTFVDIDNGILKPGSTHKLMSSPWWKQIFNAIALFDIHVPRPFHKFIMDKSTSYSSVCET